MEEQKTDLPEYVTYTFFTELVKDSLSIGNLVKLHKAIRRDCESITRHETFNPSTGELMFCLSGTINEINRGSLTPNLLVQMCKQFDIKVHFKAV